VRGVAVIQSACPRCGLPLVAATIGETVLECPECSAPSLIVPSWSALTESDADADADAAAVADPDRSGARLGRVLVTPEFSGRYQSRKVLGAGTMGVALLAEDLELGRTVALKFLARLESHDLVMRFLQEGRLMARIDHPNVVAIYDIGAVGGHPFLVSEYLSGGTLKDLLGREKRLSPRRAVDVMADCLAGLAACHQAGVIHRDLKPENILFTESGVAKLSDLGIARALEQAGASGGLVTRVGALVGTPRYMSPEQARGEPAVAASDLYAVGILLFEILAGVRPFRATSVAAMLSSHISEPPPPLRPKAPDVSEALEAVVLSGLAKRIEDRPPSADEFARRLRRALISTPRSGLKARPVSRPVSPAPPPEPEPDPAATSRAADRATGVPSVPPAIAVAAAVTLALVAIVAIANRAVSPPPHAAPASPRPSPTQPPAVRTPGADVAGPIVSRLARYVDSRRFADDLETLDRVVVNRRIPVSERLERAAAQLSRSPEHARLPGQLDVLEATLAEEGEALDSRRLEVYRILCELRVVRQLLLARLNVRTLAAGGERSRALASLDRLTDISLRFIPEEAIVPAPAPRPREAVLLAELAEADRGLALTARDGRTSPGAATAGLLGSGWTVRPRRRVPVPDRAAPAGPGRIDLVVVGRFLGDHMFLELSVRDGHRLRLFGAGSMVAAGTIPGAAALSGSLDQSSPLRALGLRIPASLLPDAGRSIVITAHPLVREMATLGALAAPSIHEVWWRPAPGPGRGPARGPTP
jgi:serine/threonine-protein kinase